MTYGNGWAFGYGSYRSESHRGRTLAVANTPNINAKTIRHIVGVPNHVRCWQRDCYREVGGHARQIHVADDYELLIRTFLGTRLARVPKLGYMQWRNRGGAIEGGKPPTKRQQGDPAADPCFQRALRRADPRAAPRARGR